MGLVNNRVQQDKDTIKVNASNLYVTGLFQFYDKMIPFKAAVATMATHYCGSKNIPTESSPT
jgi:hypothetical protein